MGRILIRSSRKFLKRVATVLWNRNDLLRLRFLLWNSFGSGSGSNSSSGSCPDLFSTVFQQQNFVKNLAFSMLEAALFPESWP
jgi:hypothetical protein